MRVSRPGVSDKAHGATDVVTMREHDTRQIVDPVVTGERPERSNDPKRTAGISKHQRFFATHCCRSLGESERQLPGIRCSFMRRRGR